MFGLFRKKDAPEGPVEIRLEMRIEKSPAEVYRHLDWADPKHTLREQGETIETIDAGQGFYRLKVAALPDHDFDFAVVDAMPGRRYSYINEVTPRLGRLESMRSHYDLESLDGGSACLVKSHAAVQFVDGMTEKQFHDELSKMSLACHNSLAKLKIHAEVGPDAVKTAEVAHVQRSRIEA